MAFALGLSVLAGALGLVALVTSWLSPLGPLHPLGITGVGLLTLALAAAFWAGRIS